MGEAVFSTAMAGYQEALSDPSYASQILCLTVPHVGNYGVNQEDIESRKLHLNGFLVTSRSRYHSNWRAKGSLDDLLRHHKIPALERVDTRALVRHLRTHGAMKAAIVTDGSPLEKVKHNLGQWAGIDKLDLTRDVTVQAPTPFVLSPQEVSPLPVRKASHPFRVAVLDLGLKRTIARNLAWRGCHLTLFPAHAEMRQILDFHPHGIFLSNGPGNPAQATAALATVKNLLSQDLPIFGICLGHQLLALALGGRTKKLPFGHRGTNHPVKDCRTGRVWITSQNHGYTVLPEDLPLDVEITHVSLHDGTVEGIALRNRPVFSVQFHPEASPGPRDALPLFDQFIQIMEEFHAS